LQLIKDYYQVEVMSMVKQWQNEVDREKQKRRDAERQYLSLKEEVARMKGEAKKQES
jgi:hypothetical protein